MEKYEELEMEVIVFDTEDVIVTSSGDDASTEWASCYQSKERS